MLYFNEEILFQLKVTCPSPGKAFTVCGTEGISGVVSSLETETVMRSDCPTLPVLSVAFTSHGVNDATANLKKIEEWWDRWPKANIGLNVGGMGWMALDLDPGHSMKELEKNVGKLPKTLLRSQTPRGGLHLFYALAPEEVVAASASTLAHAVDVRSFNSTFSWPRAALLTDTINGLEKGSPPTEPMSFMKLAGPEERHPKTEIPGSSTPISPTT